MAQSLLQLQNQVLSLLNDASASSIAEVPTGTGGTATITTPTAITYWLNQGAAILSRSCVPVFGVAALTLGAASSGTTGVYDVFLANANFTAGVGESGSSSSGGEALGALWAARGVTWQPSGGALSPVTHCARAALELANPTWQVNAAATPLYWFDEGQGNVGVYPYPSVAGTLTVAGLVTPPVLANSGDLVTWLPDDMTRLLTWYAAIQIAEKNFEDPSLAGRAPMYKADWLDGCTRMWERIDPLLRAAHFPSPPQAMQASPMAQGGDDGGQ